MGVNPVYLNSFRLGLKPDPEWTVSEWADKKRVLPKESSAEPGKWRTSRFPFTREIMDALSPHDRVQQVKVIKGTQIGGTEIGNNFLMCYMDLYPCPMLLMLPTESLLKKHRKMKLIPSVRAVEDLDKKITNGKTKNDIGDAESIQFPGGSLNFGYSNSTANFRSLSCRILHLDDVDGFPDDVEGEGDPVTLAKKRTDGFANRKIYINSTPTTKGRSKIEKEYEDSDRREYFMPCPHCGELIKFEKEHFVYEYDKDSFELIGEVRYKCYHCKELIDEHNKTWMMSEENGAKWIAQNPGHPHKGYRIPSYYSPLGFLGWTEIFREYLKAEKAMKEGDSRLMKTWVNTRDASVWEEVFEATETDDILLLRRGELYPGVTPPNTAFLVMSVDVQLDHFWYEVRALQYGNSKHVIRYGRVENWIDLEDIFSTYYDDKDGNKHMVRVCAIDSGYRTDEVYEFCAMHSNICIPIKGAEKLTGPWRVSPVAKEKDGVNIATGLKLYTINTEYFKDMLQANIDRSIATAKEGNLNKDNVLTLHNETGEDFAKQYTSEYKAEEVNKKTGAVKYIWKKRYARAANHLWDCGVYNTFLGELLGIRFLRKSNGIKKRKSSEKQPANSASDYMDEY